MRFLSLPDSRLLTLVVLALTCLLFPARLNAKVYDSIRVTGVTAPSQVSTGTLTLH